MAFSKPLSVLLILALALLVAVDGQLPPHDPPLVNSTRSLLEAPSKIDCAAACEVRCSRNWRNKLCNRMCNICCGKCSCVPPGTGQDTRGLCPCYANMVDSKTGKLKCP